MDESSPSLCFEPTKTILVYENGPNKIHATAYEHFMQFRNRYMARDRTLFFEGKPSLTLHIDRLESLDDSGRAALIPPANATPVMRRVSLSRVVEGPKSIKKVAPQYPLGAKMQYVQGTVLIWAVIDQSGHMTDLYVISGPAMLQQAAVDAVRQWTYKPFLLDGQVVQVETEIYVVFNLGH